MNARRPRTARPPAQAPRRIAVVGAGLAGITAARTLMQAGHEVTVFERAPQVGGRLASEDTPFGSFDTGAQYFTVRDPRFQQALDSTRAPCRRWSANAVRVLDAHGRVAEAALPGRESHWVATPRMDALATHWAAPLDTRVRTGCGVTAIERDPLTERGWQLRIAEAVPPVGRGPVGARCGERLIGGQRGGLDRLGFRPQFGCAHARAQRERGPGHQKIFD